MNIIVISYLLLIICKIHIYLIYKKQKTILGYAKLHTGLRQITYNGECNEPSIKKGNINWDPR